MWEKDIFSIAYKKYEEKKMCNENHTQIISKTLYGIVLQGIWKGGEDLNIQSLSTKTGEKRTNFLLVSTCNCGIPES